MKYQTAMLQDRGEFSEFINVMKAEGIKSYLEIGSKHGGTLWAMTTEVLPIGGLAVSVDLPHGDTSFKESQPHLEACVSELNRRGYHSCLFIGDSTDPKIIDGVSSLAPFDLVFIDANHTEPYVRQDWKNYGKFGRIVAFHDIGWIPRPEPSKKMPIEVPKVWAELKEQFPHHLEIKNCLRDNGIGILWR